MTIKIRARDRYLLTQAYAAGYANARMAAEAEQARLDQEVADNASWTDNAPGVIDANTIAKPLDPRRFNPNFVAPQEQSPMMVG